ncbi:MAG: FAD-dependent oxidoreductase [Acidimicrobiia bacterium]|nr:FAD-dependent oxidoreductase [Acidimicrobiia bacterium]
MKVAVIGAGWAGVATARSLFDAGIEVEVFEKSDRVGGHSRTEMMEGVVYEPNGAHIFHTSNADVARFVRRFGLNRQYEHSVVSEVFLHPDDEEGHLLSWPPQLGEIRRLSIWPAVERELSELPPQPQGEDLESHVISMMGPTLYRLFIRDYTIKQWDCEPSQLSSRLAPKRIELRDDGYRRLFRDRWEFFGPRGANEALENAAAGIPLNLDTEMKASEMEHLGTEFDFIVVTAPLDVFLGRPGELEWRGIEMRSVYTEAEEGSTATPSYVVNRPSQRVPYTRTVETKHATGQRVAGTVVGHEYPGAPARHYPVPTVDGRYERVNELLKAEVRSMCPSPVLFCGRLANYTYINQDQAILQGMGAARDILEVGP